MEPGDDADPAVESAYTAFLAIYDALTREQQEKLEARLMDTKGLFDGLKFQLWGEGMMTAYRIQLLEHNARRRKPSAEVAGRDDRIKADSYQRKMSWGELAKRYDLSIGGVRGAYARATKRAMRRSERSMRRLDKNNG
jgi:hypothetical protein